MVVTEAAVPRTLEDIENDLKIAEEAAEALRSEIGKYRAKLARLQEQYAEENRLAIAGKKGVDPWRIRGEMDTLEFHLRDLESGLPEKEAQLETLNRERQPFALQRMREFDLAELRELRRIADEKKAAWLEGVEQMRALESDYLGAEDKFRQRKVAIDRNWANVRIA